MEKRSVATSVISPLGLVQSAATASARLRPARRQRPHWWLPAPMARLLRVPATARPTHSLADLAPADLAPAELAPILTNAG